MADENMDAAESSNNLLSLSDDGNDSDKELQEAFRKGWLKPGLNYVAPPKRKLVNNVTAMRSKLAEFRKNLSWAERLDVSIGPSQIKAHTEDSLLSNAETTKDPDDTEDDFKRELKFYKQAQTALAVGLGKFRKLGIVTKRPEDYYAEMAKSDQHMKRIREQLVNIQQAKQKYEAARRLREERKFGAKVQKEVLQNRQLEKRRLNEAVKKHQKGMKGQLEDVLENRAPSQNKEPQAKGKKGKPPQNARRNFKDKKFGFGGRKKGTKSNSADSYQDTRSFRSTIHSKGPKKSGGKQRPGKARRKGMKNKKR